MTIDGLEMGAVMVRMPKTKKDVFLREVKCKCMTVSGIFNVFITKFLKDTDNTLDFLFTPIKEKGNEKTNSRGNK